MIVNNNFAIEFHMTYKQYVMNPEDQGKNTCTIIIIF